MTTPAEAGRPLEHLPSGATARWYAGSGSDVAFVVWPALGIPAGKYARLAQLLADGGSTVVVADYRGQGESRVPIARRAGWGYRAIATEDMREVVDLVRRGAPGARLVFVCHSIGGQFALALEAEQPGRFDGLALIAAGTPHWRAFRGRQRVRPLVGPSLLAALARVRGEFDGRRLGLGRQSVGLIEQWARMARTGSWQRGGHRVAARRFPALAVSFAGDAMAPESAVRALAAEFTGAHVVHRHLAEPRGHVAWLRTPEPMIRVLDEWVRCGAAS